MEIPVDPDERNLFLLDGYTSIFLRVRAGMAFQCQYVVTEIMHAHAQLAPELCQQVGSMRR